VCPGIQQQQPPSWGCPGIQQQPPCSSMRQQHASACMHQLMPPPRSAI
jgi:hypothetical protein